MQRCLPEAADSQNNSSEAGRTAPYIPRRLTPRPVWYCASLHPHYHPSRELCIQQEEKSEAGLPDPSQVDTGCWGKYWGGSPCYHTCLYRRQRPSAPAVLKQVRRPCCHYLRAEKGLMLLSLLLWKPLPPSSLEGQNHSTGIGCGSGPIGCLCTWFA